MKYDVKLGKYLMDKRRSAKLSQNDLGRKLGLGSGQFISNYENGRAPVPLDKVKVMIEILDLNPLVVIDLIQQERLEYLQATLLCAKKKTNCK